MSNSRKIGQVALATGNKGKLAEFNAKLKTLGIEMFVGPKLPSPPENGVTYYENAAIKAREGARGWKVPCVGEDSGIEVVGLGDLPGPWSARFCTFTLADIQNGIGRRSLAGFSSQEMAPGSVDQKNNELILQLLKGIPPPIV